MTTIDDMRDEYSRKLEQEKEKHEQKLKEELEQLKSPGSQKNVTINTNAISSGSDWSNSRKIQPRDIPPRIPNQVQEMVDMTETKPLRKLDNDFLNMFNLSAYYPPEKIKYETQLCESLEEFMEVRLLWGNEILSEEERARRVSQGVLDYKIKYKQEGWGVLGVNLPGIGCYVNGWQVDQKIPASGIEGRSEDQQLNEVSRIAAHEKLGHGFISAYSALGKLNTTMGLDRVRLALSFGSTPTDDPKFSLLRSQWGKIFEASKFLEEGWATWIESYLKEILFPPTQKASEKPYKHPEYLQEDFRYALEQLPREIKNECMDAWVSTFGEVAIPMEDLLTAMTKWSNLEHNFGDLFSNTLNQPLRYVLGELLCSQCEKNLGIGCVPYAVLIAANISFDPEKMGVSDLGHFLNTDPRLNPNTRLAAISRLKLDQPGNLQELTQKVNSQLSLSVPPEIRR